MKTIYNEFKRYKTSVARPDEKTRSVFVINDAKSRVLALTHKMFDDVELATGDKIIYDVRIQVQREDDAPNKVQP